MYELWDSTSLNMVDAYVSADEADQAIAAILASTGAASLRPLVLVQETDDGESVTVDDGERIIVATKRLLADDRKVSPARRSA